MTREAMLALTLTSVASHALALLALARSGQPVPPAVVTSSEALYLAAVELANPPEVDQPEAPAPCAHPPEKCIFFGGVPGYEEWECRCGAMSDARAQALKGD